MGVMTMGVMNADECPADSVLVFSLRQAGLKAAFFEDRSQRLCRDPSSLAGYAIPTVATEGGRLPPDGPSVALGPM